MPVAERSINEVAAASVRPSALRKDWGHFILFKRARISAAFQYKGGTYRLT